MESKTPLTDAHRLAPNEILTAQRFDTLLDHARRLEVALALAEERLTHIADFTNGYGDVAGIVYKCAREALREIENLKEGNHAR